ncbi:MAG TPA: hypothetical protein V6D20_22125 [Candidatus Obscuribacterales bacterium]
MLREKGLGDEEKDGQPNQLCCAVHGRSSLPVSSSAVRSRRYYPCMSAEFQPIGFDLRGKNANIEKREALVLHKRHHRSP